MSINLEVPGKFGQLVAQANQVATEIFRRNSRNRAGGIGPAGPLLGRHGVEVELARLDPDRAGRLRAVDEHR